MDKKQWHVLRTKSRAEKKAFDFLLSEGYDVYMPEKETVKIWSDRKKKVKQAIIPRYIFIKISERSRNKIFPAVGVYNYLFWLNKPVIIRDKEMKKMQKWFSDHELEDINAFSLDPGSAVTIDSGPFTGKEGIIERVGNKFISLNIPQIGLSLKVEKKKTVLKKRIL